MAAGGKPPPGARVIGSDAEQLARLDHAITRHGLQDEPCPKCAGLNAVCPLCDGWGVVFQMGDLTPCGPSCPLNDLRQN